MYHGWLALFILLMIALLIYVGVTMGLQVNHIKRSR